MFKKGGQFKVLASADFNGEEIELLSNSGLIDDIEGKEGDFYSLKEEGNIYLKLIKDGQTDKEKANKIIEKIRLTSSENIMKVVDQDRKDEIRLEIADPKNHYLRYLDPNNLTTICEISWEKFFEREFSSKKEKSVSKYKAISSLQHRKISDSIKQEGSTCFLVALQCLNEDDYLLKESIDFIHQEENKKVTTKEIRLLDSLKPTNRSNHSLIKEFRDQSYYIEESENPKLHLQNIFIDMDDQRVKKFLEKSLTKDVFDELAKGYENYEKRFFLSSKFVLEKYCEFVEKDTEESFDKKALYKNFEKYKKANEGSKAQYLAKEVNKLYKKVAELNHLESFDYEGSVTIDKQLIEEIDKKNATPTPYIKNISAQTWDVGSKKKC